MNVYQAAKDRIRKIFNDFDNVYVSFSGGKDSGVLLFLAVQVLKEEFPNRKLGVMHLDYEAQYEMTTDYVDAVLRMYPEFFKIYRVCVPFKVTTCTSMYEAYWRPWEASKNDIWVRELPEAALGEENFDFFNDHMWDYDFQTKFGGWLHKKNGASKTASLIGIERRRAWIDGGLYTLNVITKITKA